MQIFHVFECQKERSDGTLCAWPMRVGERRVPRGPDGKCVHVIEDFCRRCRVQDRVIEGERSTFCCVRRETKDRRILEDVSLAHL